MSAPAIEAHDALEAITALLGPGVVSVEPLKPGAWSSAWAFQHAGAGYVARFSAVGDDFARDAFALRFASAHLPVPPVTHRGRYGDIYVAISERVRGRFLDDLDGPEMGAMLPALLETLDAMRTADTSGTTGYGSWDASGNGAFSSWTDALRAGLQDRPADRGTGWRAKLEASPAGATAFDRDLVAFERLLDDLPGTRNVIHADLINFNCFVADGRISGVIDWGCAMYGDHLYEVAWFAFWAPWYPQWANADIPGSALRFFERKGADMAHVSERLTCYLLHIGLGHQAYNASIGRMDTLDAVIRRTAQVASEVR